MTGKFVIKKGASGRYHFNLVAGNGQVIATSEAYNTKAAALEGIESVRRNVVQSSVEDAVPFELHSLRNAYRQTVDTIQSDSQSQRAFESATALADLMRQLAQEAADLRAQAAVRIAREEKLSLSVLAGRIGISKARAAQLVRNLEDGDVGRAIGEGSTSTNA